MVRPGVLPSACFTISLTSECGACQEGPSSDYYDRMVLRNTPLQESR